MSDGMRGRGIGMIGGPGLRMIGRGSKAKDAAGTARRLWAYLSRYPGRLLSVVVTVAVSTGLAVLGPYLLGRTIDVYITALDIPGLVKIAIIMAAVYLVGSVTAWLQTFLMVGVSQPSLRDLRKALFARLQTLSIRFFDGHPRGELMSRFVNDAENISNVLTESVTQLISSALTLLGVTAMMLAMNIRLALVSILILPLMAFITRAVAKRTRKLYRSQQQNLGFLNSFIEETVSGQRVVKAYGREGDTIRRFDDANAAYRDSAIKAMISSSVLGPLSNFVANISYAVIALAGGWLVVGGMTSVGVVAAFINYAREFIRPLNHIAALYNTIQSALAGAERVFQIIDEAPEIQDAQGARDLIRVDGHVEFRDVCFGYLPKVPVLRNVDFDASPGQTIALVGPTGAGKTTVVNLLTRFYEVDSGAILIDGTDLRQLTQDTLRRKLGIVLQDTFLFSGTVRDNIRYGRLNATDQEIYRAARLSNADTFIHRLPQGYDTPLSEEAGNLSEGQRQLLAIARAILADPVILILDEATSSVDTRTEIHIQQAMLRLIKGRTSFVIAHRLRTIRRADQILVMDDGRIVERGTHQQLLEERGFYARMYWSQFRGLDHTNAVSRG